MNKLGLDIHGVIDRRPDMFATLSEIAKNRGYEVHVLTGSKVTKNLHNELKSYGIKYDNIFSILDHHEKEQKHNIWQDSQNNWWVDDDVWNKTKGIYCKREGINLHIDDTSIYGKYFETPFSHFTIDGGIEIRSNSWEDDFSREIITELTNIDEDLEIRILEKIW